MSLTVAPTNTTIRLVTTPFASTSSVIDTPPKLKPFKTSFDIVLGSPQSTAPRWPASPQGATSIYPPIPYDELISPAKPTEETASQNNVILAPHEPDIFSPVPGEKASSRLFSNTPSRPEPFLFGSPLPKNRLSNQDFGKAASSVLDEMNRRLGLAGDDKVGISLLENRGKFKIDPTPVTSAPKPDLFGFDKAHEGAFAKMDSITTHYAAKRGANQTKTTDPQSSAKEDVVPGTKKRKSTALGVDGGVQPGGSKRPSTANTRAVNNVTRKKVLPGGFGEDDEEEEEVPESRRISKRPRIHLADPALAQELPEEARKEEERKKQKEIEAVRRRADARRRSSRVSGAGPRKSVGRPSLANAKSESLSPVNGQILTNFSENKGSTSRFGFLSSAKNLVKNVWKGTGTNTAEPPKPTNIPVASSSKVVKPTAAASKPPPVVNENASSKNSKGSFRPASRFGFGSGSKTTATTSTTTSSATSSVTSSSRHDSMGQRKRGSEVRGVANANGSASSRVSNVSSNNSIGTGRTTGSTGAKRSSSTLLAPTASSLAKSRPSSSDPAPKRTSLTTGTGTAQQKRTSLLAAKEREKRRSKGITSPVLASKPALEPITNINPKGAGSSRVSGGNGASLKKIFDQPLTADTFSSSSKIPVPTSNAHTRTVSSSSATTNREDTAPTNDKPTPTTGMSRRAANVKSRGFVPRKPRISRSQVIARLGEKRAAATATSSTTSANTRPEPSATSKRKSADLGKGGRVRSSLGRQSYGGVNLKGRGSGADVMLSAKKRVRASEYYSKKGTRNSAVVQTSKGTSEDVGVDE